MAIVEWFIDNKWGVAVLGLFLICVFLRNEERRWRRVQAEKCKNAKHDMVVSKTLFPEWICDYCMLPKNCKQFCSFCQVCICEECYDYWQVFAFAKTMMYEQKAEAERAKRAGFEVVEKETAN